jgi:hypothetical protein
LRRGSQSRRDVGGGVGVDQQDKHDVGRWS